MSITLLGTVDNYDSFEYLVDTQEIDVFHLLTFERREQLYGFEDADVLPYGRAELLTKMAIRYVSKHTPDRIATSITADLYASRGEVSPPLYNPHWPRNCRQLFHLGFWPHGITIDEYSVLLYLKYTDEEIHTELALQHPSGNVYDIEATLEWIYTPAGILHSESARDGKGLQLSLQAPDLVYRSGRPKTDMAIFRNTNSNRLPYSAVDNGKCTINNEEWLTIPVTRYAAGMSKSLFYDTKPIKPVCGSSEEPSTIGWCGSSEEPNTIGWCGIFYYLEPESTTLLLYKKAHRSFNKTTAITELLTLSGHKHLISRYLVSSDPRYRGNTSLAAHINGDIPRDLIVEDGDLTYYGGKLEYDLYGVEDGLDQRLCKLAAELGYDIVVLESMVGSFQVVTEVLDVRSRHDSFLSLIYTY